MFQDTWACHFPWVELVIGDDGLVFQVRCTICNKILGKPKLLAPKLDMLQKHVGRQKAIVPTIAMMLQTTRMKGCSLGGILKLL